jgi:hypothetical protein
MKKLMIWLLLGFIATGLSVLFKSNYGVLISLVLLVMLPVGIITTKSLSEKQETAKTQETKKRSSIFVVPTEKQAFDHQLSRREKMRTEANILQAELGRIKAESNTFSRIEKLSKWKVKSEIHQSLYSDLYEAIGSVKDNESARLELVDRST